MLRITQGDPQGIGPELILRYHWLYGLPEQTRIYGNPHVFQQYASRLGLPDWVWTSLPLIEVDSSSATGATTSESFTALHQAVTDCQPNDILLTMPVSKARWQQAGIPYPGHTEFFRTHFPNSSLWMIMGTFPPHDNPPNQLPSLWVLAVTDHIPLKRVIPTLNPQQIQSAIHALYTLLKTLSPLSSHPTTPPSIAVLGVNPHAGESNLGTEEDQIIRPAISACQQTGIPVQGPFPADSFWGMGTYQQFSGVVAMYHDQAFIPFKMLAGFRGVHLTWGLPFLRLSPIHGTAEHIAGKGIASLASFQACIKVAEQWRQQRQNTPQP